MVLNNIEITVADCLLNLSRANRTTKTLPPKKRLYNVRALENRPLKRCRMNPFEFENNERLDDYNGKISQQLYHSPRSQYLPSPMTPVMFRARDAYPVGRVQIHPCSPFRYRREYLREVIRSPHTSSVDAFLSTSQTSLTVPVSPGSKSGAENESIEDVDDVEESGSASIVSESSINTEREEKDILPTGNDVLIGTGRTCSGHEGNKRFHREIYESCEEYFRADYKKGIVERVINSVHKRGGRFLANTKKGPWRLVKDMDRLERNTRKSFHMARKQKEKELPVAAPSQKVASTPQQQTQQVAVYVPEMRSFCTGWIERKHANGNLFVRFSDQRLGADWLDVATTDIRFLSR